MTACGLTPASMIAPCQKSVIPLGAWHHASHGGINRDRAGLDLPLAQWLAEIFLGDTSCVSLSQKW